MTTIPLLDARAFPEIAARTGIRESARSLVVSGRLEPLSVGRRTFYRWADLLQVMPEWSRAQHAALMGGAK